MKILEMNMDSSKLMMIQFSPNSADPKIHGHEAEYQLSIPLIGSPYIQINHEVKKFADRQWCITSPGEKHYHFANEVGSRLLLINLNKSFLEKIAEERLERKDIMIDFASWVEGPVEGFKKIATKVMKHSIDSSLEREEVREFEYELASLLFAHGKGSHSAEWKGLGFYKDHPSLRKALDYIHDDFTGDLTLDALASVTGISKYYLIRLFREYVGCTPSHYISELRLQKAEQLLRKTPLDVTAIAFEVGFGSLPTFERLFKKKYGISANEFRKRT